MSVLTVFSLHQQICFSRMGFPKSADMVSHIACAPEWTFKCCIKWDPTRLTGNSHILYLTSSFICMSCSQNLPLSPFLFSANACSCIPHGARWNDTVSVFSPLILWKQSYSTTSLGLLKSTLSPHETCFVSADNHSWPLLRKFCFCADAGYRGSSRHMLVGKKEQLCGLRLKKNPFWASTDNKEQG